MFVYLVQHGQAKSKDIDPDRHLTEKGIRDIEKVSAFIKAAGAKTDVIWHSGKTRAAQSADILGKDLISKEGIIQRGGLAPNDDPETIKKELTKSEKNIMIVSHLPFLGKLAASLLIDDDSASIVAFQQGGIVCLEKDEDMEWHIAWMVVPEIIQ
jgi:phosphohistidine phosphatase